MKTTRETQWKVAAAGSLMAAAALAHQVWQAHTSERHYAELTRQAVAQMQQQAQGCGTGIAAKHVAVPSFW
jgi:uncharacterized membrane protein YebE (DUF533 family)